MEVCLCGLRLFQHVEEPEKTKTDENGETATAVEDSNGRRATGSGKQCCLNIMRGRNDFSKPAL